MAMYASIMYQVEEKEEVKKSYKSPKEYFTVDEIQERYRNDVYDNCIVENVKNFPI